MGGNHTYNTRLYSDGAAKLSFMDIIREDGGLIFSGYPVESGFRPASSLKTVTMRLNFMARA